MQLNFKAIFIVCILISMSSCRVTPDNEKILYEDISLKKAISLKINFLGGYFDNKPNDIAKSEENNSVRGGG